MGSFSANHLGKAAFFVVWLSRKGPVIVFFLGQRLPDKSDLLHEMTEIQRMECLVRTASADFFFGELTEKRAFALREEPSEKQAECYLIFSAQRVIQPRI